MSKRKDSLVTDVEGLLKQSVIADASSKIWEKFESAMANLDDASVDLLTAHFRGVTVKELSAEKKMSEADVEAWLKKTKRELVQSLRTSTQVRN